jgi:hypothetical protein
MINGVEHPELAENESVTLRAPNESSGSSKVELRIRNTKKILQGASLGFSANFKTGNSKTNNVSF